MFNQKIISCNNFLRNAPCCNTTPGHMCNCYNELWSDFHTRPDTYNCDKKMNYYALNYGASYISEYYHYISQSQLIQNILINNDNVCIKSLGCGFAPDYYAIQKYCIDNGINCNINYTGYDISSHWGTIRPHGNNINFINCDISSNIDLQNADIIIIGKVFSTLLRNQMATSFISTLKNAITTTMPQNSILVFNDINHVDFGRDLFDSSVAHLFSVSNKFYFNGYQGKNWTHINQPNIIYQIPAGLTVTPLLNTGSTIVFEYRK